MNLSHLDVIQGRIDRETDRFAVAVHNRNEAKPGSRKFAQWQNEVAFREHQIAMAQKEKAGERKFLGLPEADSIDNMSIDDLLSELG